MDAGTTMLPRITETDSPSAVSYKIPTHADFLIAYSTVPGTNSPPMSTNGYFLNICIRILLLAQYNQWFLVRSSVVLRDFGARPRRRFTLSDDNCISDSFDWIRIEHTSRFQHASAQTNSLRYEPSYSQDLF